MNLISPKIHAYLDYITAAILIGIPWMFLFQTSGAEMWVPILVGLITLTYSIFTRFKNEHFGIIPLKTHVILDVIFGVLLGLSPWIANFTEVSAIPYVVVGLAICVVALFTDVPPKPATPPQSNLE